MWSCLPIIAIRSEKFNSSNSRSSLGLNEYPNRDTTYIRVSLTYFYIICACAACMQYMYLLLGFFRKVYRLALLACPSSLSWWPMGKTSAT